MKKIALAFAGVLAATAALGEDEATTKLWSSYETFSSKISIPLATPAEGGITSTDDLTSDNKWYSTATSQDCTFPSQGDDGYSPVTTAADYYKGNTPSGNGYLSIDASDGELVVNINGASKDSDTGIYTFDPVEVGVDETASEDAGEDAVNGSVYVDTLVKFTASEAAPEVDPEDKLVVWYSADEVSVNDITEIVDNGDDTKTTNTVARTLSAGLKVTANKNYNGTLYPYVYSVNTPSDIDLTNSWTRLTVKTLVICDSDMYTGAQVFRVYLNGIAKPLTAQEAHGCVSDSKYAADNTMFVSLAHTSDDFESIGTAIVGGTPDLSEYGCNLTAVAFEGQGLIDDFIFADSVNVAKDTGGNAFAERDLDTTVFTINLGANAYYYLTYVESGSGETTTDEIHDESAKYTTYQGTGATIELYVDEGCVPGIVVDKTDDDEGTAVTPVYQSTVSDADGKFSRYYIAKFTAKEADVEEGKSAEQTVDITISAITEVPYTTDLENCTIAFSGDNQPTGEGKLAPNTTYTFTVTPTVDYKVSSVALTASVDGTATTAPALTQNDDGSYTFKTGYDDVKITAKAIPATYSVTYKGDEEVATVTVYLEAEVQVLDSDGTPTGEKTTEWQPMDDTSAIEKGAKIKIAVTFADDVTEDDYTTTVTTGEETIDAEAEGDDDGAYIIESLTDDVVVEVKSKSDIETTHALTFDIGENATVTYTIGDETATATSSTNVEVAENTSVTLTFTAADGYELETVTVGGTDVSGDLTDGSYTFTMDAAKAVVVTAKKAESGSKESYSDGTSENAFTIDTSTVTLPAGVESLGASTGKGGGITYAQAYALGLWNGTAEGEVAEPKVSIEIVDGQVKVSFGDGTTKNEAYTVTCTLQYKTDLKGDWQDFDTAITGEGLGATLTDSSAMDEKKFYRVLVTIKDAE